MFQEIKQKWIFLYSEFIGQKGMNSNENIKISTNSKTFIANSNRISLELFKWTMIEAGKGE